MRRSPVFPVAIASAALAPLILALAAVLAQAACQTAPPPGLSPAGQTAFAQTRAIQALDLVRDAAISANEQPASGCSPSAETPCQPLLSTSATRHVVEFHKSAIALIHEGGAGWRADVLTGLDVTLAHLSPGERAYLTPYAALLRSILQEATR